MLAKCLILGVLLVSLAAANQSTGEPSSLPSSGEPSVQDSGTDTPSHQPTFSSAGDSDQPSSTTGVPGTDAPSQSGQPAQTTTAQPIQSGEPTSDQPTTAQLISDQPISQSTGQDSKEPTSQPTWWDVDESAATCADLKTEFGDLNCCGSGYRSAQSILSTQSTSRCRTIRADYRRGCNWGDRCTPPNGGTQPGTQTTTNPAQNPNNIQSSTPTSTPPTTSEPSETNFSG